MDFIDYVCLALVIAMAWHIGTRIHRAKARKARSNNDDQRSITAPVIADGMELKIDMRFSALTGEPSQRQVTVQRIRGQLGPRGGIESINYIEGHCHLRNAERTFNILGIHSIIDPATGNSITGLRTIERWLGNHVRAHRKAQS